MSGKKIMIVGAMCDVELNILIDRLNEKKVVCEKACTFYEGEIEGHEVVICHSSVGTINAAMASVLGISRYEVESIIMTGTAGGHGKDVHKGDIVVSTGVINLNSIATSELKEGEGSNPYLWEFKRYGHAEEDENSIVIDASESLIELAKASEKGFAEKEADAKIHYGIIGSGDIWNKEVDRINFLASKYGTLCEEMEGAAVFQVARLYNVPTVAIRCISNNEIFGETYDRMLGERAQEYVLCMLKNKKEI